jgi:gamma-aminobutyric acid type B receptor
MRTEIGATFVALALLALPSRGSASSIIDSLTDVIYPPVSDGDGRTPLYFSLIQSFTGQYISANSVPGLQMALDFINDNETLLPGYRLHYVFTDAACDRKAALNAFHHQVFEGHTKIGVIGSGCSVSTEPTATISHYYNQVQVSCIASSPAFRDRTLFPRYFQLLTTDASQAAAFFSIIQHYGWKRVALIVQDENLFTVAIDELKADLFRVRIDYTEETLVVVDGTVEGLSRETFDEYSRIFIVAGYQPIAQQIMCEAYRNNFRYPRYLFFTISWYPDGWWTSSEQYGCTAEQMEQVLEHTLSIVFLPGARYLNATLPTDTKSGLTIGEYLRLEREYDGRPPLNTTVDDLSPVCYDAMFTFAYALNSTINDLGNNETLNRMASKYLEDSTLPFRIENFSYENEIVMETMFRHLENTNFRGVSGNVRFDELGIRDVTQYIVLQYRRRGGLENAVVGRITANLTFIFEPGESDDTTWPMGVPYDGVTVNEEVLAVHLGLTVVLMLFSSSGILFSMACLLFNFYFRNSKLIRLTSPNLNYLIGSGAILLYIAIIVTVWPATTATVSSVMCNLQVWLTGIGYSLCYGTILVKMWRVYYIFNNPSTQKKKFHDWMLALMVLCFVVIDVVMLVVYSGVERAKGELGAKRVADDETHNIEEGNQGIPREFYVYICSSLARDIFLGIFYGYKALLQVCGLFLAFATRKVKVKGLDDAKWIAATIYITSIVLAITILSLYTLGGLQNRFSAVFTNGLFIGTTFIMAFVFVPKMHSLWKDPEGKTVFTRSGPTESQKEMHSQSA